MPFRHQHDLIGRFAHHPVAANLLMLMMVLAGVWALSQLNTQFFPNFALDIVNVRVVWPGAPAEDVERSVTDPLEQAFRGLDGLRKMTSTSANGMASVSLEYEEGTEMGEALDRVKTAVDLVRNLPEDAEEPEVERVVRYDPIARVLLVGPDPAELRHLTRRMEDELLARGIAQVTVTGLPEEEMAIQVPAATLRNLGLTLPEIGRRVADMSRDLPAGSVGRSDVARQLRSLDQRRTAREFEDLPVVADPAGRLLTLGDIARIQRRPQDQEVRVTYRGEPAVELRLQRAENSDALEAAHILTRWAAEAQHTLPPGVDLVVYDEAWRLIDERIRLLLTNGLGGLLLVVAILFLFLHGRVAFWVAVGIPVSFMATLAALLALGGSINMISLFGLIMALGIIVDDAIVVGEDAFTHYQTGENPLEAAEGGARRMLAPVMSSSLTTISAFLPLMLVGGPIGRIMSAIPLVIVCVILASLVESFLVLPGHLRHTFHRMHHARPGPGRRRLDNAFVGFRERVFRPLVAAAVRARGVTLGGAAALLILAFGLVAGGRIGFTFFPTPEGNILYANVNFTPGSPPERVDAFLDHLQETLRATEQDYGTRLVNMTVAYHGSGVSADGRAGSQRGDYIGSLMVELVSSEHRPVRNPDLLAAWEDKIVLLPGIEAFTLSERMAGPPGRDVEVRLVGQDAATLKRAAEELAVELRRFRGVSGIEDDMPYGQGQLVFELTPLAESLGLTVNELGRQVRAAYTGHLAQIYQDDEDEVEVRVMLPDAERYDLASLERLDIAVPGGEGLPLASLVSLAPRRGFEVLRHAEGRLAVTVTAGVDTRFTKAGQVLAKLDQAFLPELARRYGISYSFEGRAADQRETMADMKRGGLLALVMIYLVLAWVFASYGRPLVVMAAIPFGLTGAIAGHWLMGIDLTVLSMFGLFGLSGIVVNDSIILVTFYRHLRDQGMGVQEAIVEAACLRLRAVLLTSLTTIAGLTPLLFETSLQAQFLIPMAVSISFGLGFATVLVLLVIPALLSLLEGAAEARRRRRARAAAESEAAGVS
jgi:multidrug efflux pump subunit AcrB